MTSIKFKFICENVPLQTALKFFTTVKLQGVPGEKVNISAGDSRPKNKVDSLT